MELQLAHRISQIKSIIATALYPPTTSSRMSSFAKNDGDNDDDDNEEEDEQDFAEAGVVALLTVHECIINLCIANGIDNV